MKAVFRMFSRTAQGLSNEHLFYSSQCVVYCEGKGTDHAYSFDQMFWKNIFSKCGINATPKSLGSKETVIAMANEVIEKDISNVVVALDADYDRFYNETIGDRRVIYTFGYSFESDICFGLDFLLTLNLFVNSSDPQAESTKFSTFLSQLDRNLSRAAIVDARYIKRTVALFDRKKPQSLIVSTPSGPVLNLRMFLSKLAAVRASPKAGSFIPPSERVNGLRSFFGKMVSKVIYTWFHRLSSRLSGRRVDYDVFLANAICHIKLGVAGDDMYDHYNSSIAAALSS
ncbi:hypothetical protein [Labrys neptuniae]